MANANIWYVVAVVGADGAELDNSMCGNLEMARRAVARFRILYSQAEWITTNRRKQGRITALVSMTVHKGTTAQERRELAIRRLMEASRA